MYIISRSDSVRKAWVPRVFRWPWYKQRAAIKKGEKTPPRTVCTTPNISHAQQSRETRVLLLMPSERTQEVNTWLDEVKGETVEVLGAAKVQDHSKNE